MDVSLFDFVLPEGRIALRPARPRDAARMLVLHPDDLADRCVRDLPAYVSSGDAVVFNNTRVIPARLIGRRGDASIEITLHKAQDAVTWSVFARPAKRLKPADRLVFGTLEGEVVAKGDGGEVTIRFDVEPGELRGQLAANGLMPLPPYIARRRAADARDLTDYQTLLATEEGAVAAPTAGLHFTDRLMAQLTATGANLLTVTLHVGAGTFLPVKVSDTTEHRMHAEWGRVEPRTAQTLNTVRSQGGRIFAVGTTSLRLLEAATDGEGRIGAFEGETDIFIAPGYRFRAADVLLTNFHLPRSTLFMLVSAFSGLDRMKAAYAHAIDAGYRFYSYGDACLLYRSDEAS